MGIVKRALFLAFLSTCLAGCMQAPDAVAEAEASLSAGDLLRFARGRNLYFNEEFDGNDRTCETCHVRNLLNGDVTDNSFDLSPEIVEAAFSEDPSGPLFRSLDSNDGVGTDYSDLLEDALIRVHVVAAPNVSIAETGDPNVRVLPDGRFEIALRRSVPTSINSALNDFLMWDGREADLLAHQAISAVNEHAEPGRQPTATEAGNIAFFQSQLFSSDALRSYAAGGPSPTLPEVSSTLSGSYGDSLRRGRTFFVSSPITSFDMANRGLCATCHSGPMLNTTNEFNPGDPPGLRFAGNRTSEFNARDLPEYTFSIALPDDLLMPPGAPFPIPPGTLIAPAGTPITVHTSDPGALIVDTTPGDGVDAANPCISPIPCILQVLQGTPTVVFHRIPTLYGTASTAPYFHDNSAATFEEVVDHYRAFFVPTQFSLRAAADGAEAAGDLTTAVFLRSIADALEISDQDKADIAAYMRYAFR